MEWMNNFNVSITNRFVIIVNFTIYKITHKIEIRTVCKRYPKLRPNKEGGHYMKASKGLIIFAVICLFLLAACSSNAQSGAQNSGAPQGGSEPEFVFKTSAQTPAWMPYRQALRI